MKRSRFASGNSGNDARTRAIERLVDRDRQEIGIGEVAIVVRFFLAAHRPRLFAVGIEEPGFLRDFAAAFDELDLPRSFDLDGFLDEAERIQVLELAFACRAWSRRAGAPRRSRRNGTSLPACCRRRSRGSARARGSCACTRRLRRPSADRARRRSRAGGVPARFKSMPDMPAKSSCSDLPASSSRCARMMPTVRVLPSSSTTSAWPPCTIGSSYWLI